MQDEEVSTKHKMKYYVSSLKELHKNSDVQFCVKF